MQQTTIIYTYDAYIITQVVLFAGPRVIDSSQAVILFRISVRRITAVCPDVIYSSTADELYIKFIIALCRDRRTPVKSSQATPPSHTISEIYSRCEWARVFWLASPSRTVATTESQPARHLHNRLCAVRVRIESRYDISIYYYIGTPRTGVALEADALP